MQAKGQGLRAPRRGAHRKKRPRKPLPGMMLHQDGSRHEGGGRAGSGISLRPWMMRPPNSPPPSLSRQKGP
ncbi:MAG: hypothetical protein OJF50_004515 [Nitrospira sp.]|nr:hypothetical protein [Nitrospira sp.]MDI3465694.1 hypothetical protein [Nitrospira sp.]